MFALALEANRNLTWRDVQVGDNTKNLCSFHFFTLFVKLVVNSEYLKRHTASDNSLTPIVRRVYRGL